MIMIRRRKCTSLHIGILKDVRDIAHIKQVQDVINKAHSENRKKYVLDSTNEKLRGRVGR